MRGAEYQHAADLGVDMAGDRGDRLLCSGSSSPSRPSARFEERNFIISGRSPDRCGTCSRHATAEPSENSPLAAVQRWCLQAAGSMQQHYSSMSHFSTL